MRDDGHDGASADRLPSRRRSETHDATCTRSAGIKVLDGAEEMKGWDGHTLEAIDRDRLVAI